MSLEGQRVLNSWGGSEVRSILWRYRQGRHHAWRNPVDRGFLRSYENSIFLGAIRYIFFKELGRIGGREAASKPRSS